MEVGRLESEGWRLERGRSKKMEEETRRILASIPIPIIFDERMLCLRGQGGRRGEGAGVRRKEELTPLLIGMLGLARRMGEGSFVDQFVRALVRCFWG